MGKKKENSGFTCVVCKKCILPLKRGFRNHCPFCLRSLHVDSKIPGDRKSTCHGIMEAIQLKSSGKKGWQIVHKCQKCCEEKVNKIAEGDVQPDDWDMIVNLGLNL